MDILDIRTGIRHSGEITKVGWNFTMGKERVVVTLDTGFQVEISQYELNRIRPHKFSQEVKE